MQPKAIIRLTPAAALLAAAQSSDDQRLKIKALRGVTRLASDKSQADTDRLKLLGGAMKIAPRPEEKREILGALATVKSGGAIEIALTCIEDDPVRDEAANTIVRVATLLGKPMAQSTRDALTTVTKTTRNGNFKNQAQRLLDQNKP